jgi:predicted nucleic acid-binding protein
MIVVTDTSVVLNLCLLRLEEVLSTRYGEVQAPEAVKDEFVRLANVESRKSCSSLCHFPSRI